VHGTTLTTGSDVKVRGKVSQCHNVGDRSRRRQGPRPLGKDLVSQARGGGFGRADRPRDSTSRKNGKKKDVYSWIPAGRPPRMEADEIYAHGGVWCWGVWGGFFLGFFWGCFGWGGGSICVEFWGSVIFLGRWGGGWLGDTLRLQEPSGSGVAVCAPHLQTCSPSFPGGGRNRNSWIQFLLQGNQKLFFE